MVFKYSFNVYSCIRLLLYACSFPTKDWLTLELSYCTSFKSSTTVFLKAIFSWVAFCLTSFVSDLLLVLTFFSCYLVNSQVNTSTVLTTKSFFITSVIFMIYTFLKYISRQAIIKRFLEWFLNHAGSYGCPVFKFNKLDR